MEKRTFVTNEGEVLDKSEYYPSPYNSCFYCGTPVVLWSTFKQCPSSQDYNHDWVTVVHPEGEERNAG